MLNGLPQIVYRMRRAPQCLLGMVESELVHGIHQDALLPCKSFRFELRIVKISVAQDGCRINNMLFRVDDISYRGIVWHQFVHGSGS